jgi:hypothetical protein
VEPLEAAAKQDGSDAPQGHFVPLEDLTAMFREAAQDIVTIAKE